MKPSNPIRARFLPIQRAIASRLFNRMIPAAMRKLLRELGLDTLPPFYKDPPFLLAVAAGGLFWFLLALLRPLTPMAPRQLFSMPFLFLVVWQPLFEEILFRGFLQGTWSESPWGKRLFFGISGANLLVSVLFTLAHFWTHPPLWAASVFFPSLLFGYFRDRSGSLYPSLFLHMFYNGGYFFLTGIPA